MSLIHPLSRHIMSSPIRTVLMAFSKSFTVTVSGSFPASFLSNARSKPSEKPPRRKQATVKDFERRAYGANPGLDMICREAGVKATSVSLLRLSPGRHGEECGLGIVGFLRQPCVSTCPRWRIRAMLRLLFPLLRMSQFVSNQGKKTEKDIQCRHTQRPPLSARQGKRWM